MSRLASPSDELRLRRLVERVHQLGAPALLHLVRDLDSGAALLPTLERYARLDPAFVHGLGGGQFVQPVRLLTGGVA